ncbi:hypothetical protein DFH06DRAFT_1122836 [Mycena polygramma]|nr:hypothetical protein DFH06DRAFT_1122836 [Mycena polygramma]
MMRGTTIVHQETRRVHVHLNEATREQVEGAEVSRRGQTRVGEWGQEAAGGGEVLGDEELAREPLDGPHDTRELEVAFLLITRVGSAAGARGATREREEAGPGVEDVARVDGVEVDARTRVELEVAEGEARVGVGLEGVKGEGVEGARAGA